jgi:hypothetical protein
MPPADKDLGLCLESGRLLFVDEKTFFVIRKDGMIHPIEIILDGRTVSKFVLLPVIAQTTIRAVAKLLNDDLLFVESMVGPSVLMKTAREEVSLELPAQQTSAATAINFSDSMDLDDDDGWLPTCITKLLRNSTNVSQIYMAIRRLLHRRLLKQHREPLDSQLANPYGGTLIWLTQSRSHRMGAASFLVRTIRLCRNGAASSGALGRAHFFGHISLVLSGWDSYRVWFVR